MSYLIIIRGPLGCGKSTISKAVAKKINAKYFSIDRALDENDLTNDREEGYVSQKSFKKANEIVCEKIRPLLEKGIPVVIDGNFYWRSQVEDLIERLTFPNYVFTLKAPLEVCIERDAARDKTHGKMAAEVVYSKSTEFDFGEIIDVTKPIEDSVQSIISKVQ